MRITLQPSTVVLNIYVCYCMSMYNLYMRLWMWCLQVVSSLCVPWRLLLCLASLFSRACFQGRDTTRTTATTAPSNRQTKDFAKSRWNWNVLNNFEYERKTFQLFFCVQALKPGGGAGVLCDDGFANMVCNITFILCLGVT